MGILGRISNIKAKFRGVQRAIEGGHREKAIEEAKRLGVTTEQIRERRIAEKQKYSDVYRKERMKQVELQAKAKAKQGPTIVRFAKGLKKTIDESKARGQVRQNVFSTGGSGLDFGGNKKKEVKPPKKKRIIIEM